MDKLKKIKHKFQTIWQQKIAKDLVGTAHNANIGLLFLLAMGHMLSGVASFIVLPVAIGTSLMHAILDIRDAYKTRRKSKYSDAVASTITALGVIAAVVCTFAGGAALGAVAPAILTGVLGLQALYDLGAGCYFWYKYHKLKYQNPEKAAYYYQQAKEHTVAFVVAALAAGAAAGLLIGNHSSFGAIGIAAGAIGAGYASYGLYKVYKEYQARKIGQHTQTAIQNNFLEQPEESPTSTNAFIYQQMGYNPQPQPQPQESVMVLPNQSSPAFVFDLNPNYQPIAQQQTPQYGFRR